MSGSGFDFDLFAKNHAAVYSAPNDQLAQVAMAARDTGLLTIEVDLSGCRDKSTLLLRMNSALDAPAGSGRNWDALSDLLRDLSWLGDAPGHVLLLGAAGQLRTAAKETFDTLVEVLQDAVDFWSECEIPFWAFVGFPENELSDGDEASASG